MLFVEVIMTLLATPMEYVYLNLMYNIGNNWKEIKMYYRLEQIYLLFPRNEYLTCAEKRLYKTNTLSGGSEAE